MAGQVEPVAWKKWLGIGLIGLSGMWFAGLLLVPFSPFPLEIKALFAFLFLVSMEACFWIGTVIVGKQAVSRFWISLKNRRTRTGK